LVKVIFHRLRVLLRVLLAQLCREKKGKVLIMQDALNNM
jgi:hypothetical protein